MAQSPSAIGLNHKKPFDRLSTSDFHLVSTLIGDAVGICLPPPKLQMVEGRIRHRLRALSFSSFSTYCDYVFREGGLERELPHLINVLTTNTTNFFREPQHFKLLRSKLVDDLLLVRRAEPRPLLKVWSAASSTGAEAYTIAMELADLAELRKDFRFSILGTDISTEVLDVGRRAVYSAEQVDSVPSSYQDRFLLWSKRQDRKTAVRIVPELRRLVNFQMLNLKDTAYPIDKDVDMIFLRNVLIYFDKADQEAVVQRIAQHLRPGGYLLLGHSEPMVNMSVPLNQVAPATYQRPA